MALYKSIYLLTYLFTYLNLVLFDKIERQRR